MIKKITIRNYQSHSKSTLEFDKNVNSIIGSSNKGKTAALRALLWVLTNRPRGDAYISHWVDNEPTSVIIETDKGKVERRRTKKFNGYIINDTDKFEALKGDVPEEIKKIIKIEDVNIQKQLDAPFLISNSAGEVARFFNKIIKLDLIDVVLSEVDVKRRRTKKELTAEKVNAIQIMENIEKLNWIEDAEKLINRARIINNRYNDMENKSRDFSISTAEYRNQRRVYREFNWIDDVQDLFDELYYYEKQIDYILDEQSLFSSMVKSYKKEADIYNEIVSEISEYITKIEKLDKKISDLQDEYDDITDNISDYSVSEVQVKQITKKIKELKLELPIICPTCGKKLGGKNEEISEHPKDN